MDSIKTQTNGEGVIYANGVWLARVQYSVAPNGSHILRRVCDGERDLFAPPIPANELLLEMTDGYRCNFCTVDGNPTSGTYTVCRLSSVG